MLKYFRTILSLCLFAVNIATQAAPNTAPTIALIAPAAGTGPVAPATITLTATASDRDGTISKVAFYRGSTLIGTSVNTSSPFNFVWTNVAAGPYALTAKATDNLGAVGTSPIINMTIGTATVSSVTITSPVAGAVVYGENVSLTGTFVGDPASTTIWVDNGNTTRLALATSNTYTATIPISVGSNQIKVTAVKRDRTSAVAIVSINGSLAPIVSFVSPQNASPSAPANITLRVDAFSPTGTVSKVTFFNSGTQLAAMTTEPYQFIWNGVAKGTYTITAEATDNLGVKGTAEKLIDVLGPNLPPIVNLNSPNNGGIFQAPAALTLAANASDPDGSIVQVEFLRNGTLLGASNVSPYVFGLTGLGAGDYSFAVRATDDRGATATSTAIGVKVVNPNTPPVVALTSPVTGAVFVVPATIQLAATASDTDGSVSKVEYFSGLNLIASAGAAPFTAAWINADAGTHSVTARATDNFGLTSTSNVSTIFVDGPRVAITNPATSVNVISPALVALTVSAAPSNGANVTKVEFFDATRLLGSSSIAPYSFTWANVDAGVYQITAKVTDSRGLTAVSVPLEITVAPAPFSATVMSPADSSIAVLGQPLTVKLKGVSQTSTIAKIELLDGDDVVLSFVTGTHHGVFTWTAPWVPTVAGTRSLRARVTDAQLQIVLSPSVMVTVYTREEMPQVRFETGGRFYVGRGFIDLYASARPPQGSTIQKVEYLNGSTVIATKTAPPFEMTWAADPGNYSLSARATDSLGRATTSDYVTIVVASAPEVSIASGINGSTIDGSSLSISGFLKAPPNSAIEVNGKFAVVLTDGSFVIDNIPLQIGSNNLAVNVRTVDDQLTSTAITVTSIRSSVFEFRALRASGLNKHSTSFLLTAAADAVFTRAELKCYEGGAISSTVTDVNDLLLTTCLYPQPGLFVASIKIFNGTDIVHEARQHIRVSSVLETAKLARGAFSGLMARLGDGKSELALASVVADHRTDFARIFTSLGGKLSTAVNGFGKINNISVTSDIGEVSVLRGIGLDQSVFIINVMRCNDGIWRVVSM